MKTYIGQLGPDGEGVLQVLSGNEITQLIPGKNFVCCSWGPNSGGVVAWEILNDLGKHQWQTRLCKEVIWKLNPNENFELSYEDLMRMIEGWEMESNQ